MPEASARDVEISKLLSYVLRHKPESIGLQLAHGGWAEVDSLLACLAASGKQVSMAELERTIETSDKQRFALSEDRRRIRANQGHSVPVDLQLPAVEPPARLFHGTATKYQPSIEQNGLRPGQRQHVHLSTSPEVARAVGSRHGKAIVFAVEAGAMHASGFKFYLAANGVWLTEHVPSSFLRAASVA